MKISSAILISKKCHSHHWISGTQVWMRTLKTVMLLPNMVCWGGGGMQEARWTGLTPDGWGTYEKNEFSEPRGVHLPIHRILNSLTWYLILMFTWPALFVISLYIAQFFCPPPWSSFLRATEMLSLHIAHKFFSRVLDVTLHPWRKIPPLKERDEKCRHQSGGNTQWRKC